MNSMAFMFMFMQIARRTFTGVSTRVEGAPGAQPLPQFSFAKSSTLGGWWRVLLVVHELNSEGSLGRAPHAGCASPSGSP